MENINVFKRYELKYIINQEQKKVVMREVLKRMQPDTHGESTVRNMYFDTPDSRLIRSSIDKPVYKEKFRIRGYTTAGPETVVFAEIKKKYKSVVYKRRISLDWNRAVSFLASGQLTERSQISKEINYFFELYKQLAPAMFITYERAAFYDGEFKVTFDDNILYRNYDISLDKSPYGKPVLPSGFTLMELKTPEALPLWMTEILTKTKFTKHPSPNTEKRIKKF